MSIPSDIIHNQDYGQYHLTGIVSHLHPTQHKTNEVSKDNDYTDDIKIMSGIIKNSVKENRHT